MTRAPHALCASSCWWVLAAQSTITFDSGNALTVPCSCVIAALRGCIESLSDAVGDGLCTLLFMAAIQLSRMPGVGADRIYRVVDA